MYRPIECHTLSHYTTIGLREVVNILLAKQYRPCGLQHTSPAIVNWALKFATASGSKTLDPGSLTENLDYLRNHDAAEIGLHIYGMAVQAPAMEQNNARRAFSDEA